MPHSVSPERSPSSSDTALPDAPQQSTPSQEAKPVIDHEVDMLSDGQNGEIQTSSPSQEKEQIKLEDLFGDDDEDDEFSSSAPQISKADPDTPEAPTTLAHKKNDIDPETMYAFYQRLFPFRYLFQWLNHSPLLSPDFANREFAITLRNDAYLRYQAFPSADLLRKDILRHNPARFEIGPVYNTNPRDKKTLRKSTAFKPLTKEMVFDIDLTDYDEIRTCCSKANICHKCWSFITMAIKVVDAALREDFGFMHIMWVYSGRRGAHAWICDKRAREMDDYRRKAIAGYLELVKGGAQSGKKVNIKRPLHPHISRSLEILKDHFQTDILTDQDPWAEYERSERLLQLLPDKALNDALRKKWDSAPGRSSVNKWADIDALAKTGASKTLNGKDLLEAKQDIVLEYTYPRLDVEVSKKLIHLLKSPFVVHPGTGRVCVPIDTSKLEQFDPLSVPKVTDLLKEIDTWDREKGVTQGEGKRLQDYEKTSLKPYVEFFKSFVATLLRSENKVKREREEDGAGDAMEF